MRIARVGRAGAERPVVVTADGTLLDLRDADARHRRAFLGTAGHGRHRCACNAFRGGEDLRFGVPVHAARQGGRHRAQLPRPRRRGEGAAALRAGRLPQGADLGLRAHRRHPDAAAVGHDRLRGGARRRPRGAAQATSATRTARRWRRRRLRAGPRRLRPCAPARARRHLDQGQVGRHLLPGRTVAGHPRRAGRPRRRPAAPDRQRRPQAGRVDRRHAVLRRRAALLRQRAHDPGAGRPRRHRHPCGRGDGPARAAALPAPRRRRRASTGECSGSHRNRVVDPARSAAPAAAS